MLSAALLALPMATTLVAAPFDKVLLHDGRLIEGKLIETADPDQIVIQLPGADIPILKELVDKTYVEDLEDYVPKNDKERQNLERGLVLFEGRWMSRTRRETELRQRAEEDEAAIVRLREEQSWRNAREFESLHFAVKTNCRDDVVDEYVERLEQYYKEFIGAWRIKVAPSMKRQKQKFFLYRNQEDFAKINGVSSGVLGFFNWVDGELHLFHDDQDPAFTISVLYHEGNHLLTHLIDPRYQYPSWMNEGMAEYFGSARVDEKGDFHVGDLQYKRIATMRNDEAQGRAIGLRDLLLTPRERFTGRHYAFAWSFNHFLMTTKRYSSAYKSFFAKLPDNSRVDVVARSYRDLTGALRIPDLESLVAALEKQLRTSLDELEEEWLEYRAQTYGELTAPAYYYAARITLSTNDVDQDSVRTSMGFLQKAAELGIRSSLCYRSYAEMLRKGGIDERGTEVIVQRPDPVKAWEMVEKAIELDPINPLNYCEAGGILILTGEVQDLDRAQAMAKTARALAPRDPRAHALVDELEGKIEKTREKLLAAAEEARADARRWMVQPKGERGQHPPPRIENLTTAALVEMVSKGEVGGEDWVFQTFQELDEATGEYQVGPNKWDAEWVLLRDVPEFAALLTTAADQG